MCLKVVDTRRVGGFHPGIVILDEPLQQNPDDQHRDLFNTFLRKQLAQQSVFQTVVFTFLRDTEIDSLRKECTRVITPEGKHFLKAVPPSPETKTHDPKPEPVGEETMSKENMCSHCGEQPAVTLKITKHDPDLDGLGVGWPETLAVLEDNDYRVVLESRAIRKLNHKSETVRIRLRGLEAFMRWVVVSTYCYCPVAGCTSMIGALQSFPFLVGTLSARYIRFVASSSSSAFDFEDWLSFSASSADKRKS
jgi:hypothetical protein